MEVEAPIAEAQLVETFVMNQIHLQTVLASKAARVVAAARGRAVVDFGLRRVHGIDAGLKAARAFHIAGVRGTSNVAAGQAYGLPLAGTLAHSYIQAHDDEREAFRRFAALYPGTVLLVDTYDTVEGVRRVVDVAREMGPAFRISGVRLDSGDLADLSVKTRRMLDEAGLRDVTIFASGGLDEEQIDALLAAGAPIDAFGVGTDMGVSRDAPTLDIAYKLVEYGGKPRAKLSTGKVLLPGRKQVFRVEQAGMMAYDVLGRRDEASAGRPLLERVLEGGRRTAAGRVGLSEIRARAEAEIARLPRRLRGLDPASPPFEVKTSDALAADAAAVRREHEREAVRP
jgi:nicotinate phosphoribosyltransferase